MTGSALMAAGVAGLALGLPAYGAFRLLAAAWYALDDSRTPALAAVVSAADRRGPHDRRSPR